MTTKPIVSSPVSLVVDTATNTIDTLSKVFAHHSTVANNVSTLPSCNGNKRPHNVCPHQETNTGTDLTLPETSTSQSAATTTVPHHSLHNFSLSCIQVEPSRDGEGLEAIMQSSSRLQNSSFRRSTDIRASLLVADPFMLPSVSSTLATLPPSSSSFPFSLKTKTMSRLTLTINQGKDIPIMNRIRVRVALLNEEGIVEEILGTTAASAVTFDNGNGRNHHIWGTTFSFLGTSKTQLRLTLIEEHDSHNPKKGSSPSQNKKSLHFSPSSIILGTTLEVQDIFAYPHLNLKSPNRWITVHRTEAGCRSKPHGSIQLRCTIATDVKIHEQERCTNLSPGPNAGLAKMKSYAIRKAMIYSHSPVLLNVYDVSNDHRVELLNDAVKPLGYGGIFHGAIEIHGKEYSYGGTRDRRSRVSGVFTCPPKKCTQHHYRESIYLGDCDLPMSQVNDIVQSLRPKWIARDYDLFRKNCVFFSRELAVELGVGDIPEWVFALAGKAEPYALKLNHYLAKRKTTKATEAPTPATRKDSKIQAGVVAAPEELLDHAMAATIQRSFRSKNKKRGR